MAARRGGSPAAAARRLIIARTTRRSRAPPVRRRPAGSMPSATVSSRATAPRRPRPARGWLLTSGGGERAVRPRLDAGCRCRWTMATSPDDSRCPIGRSTSAIGRGLAAAAPRCGQVAVERRRRGRRPERRPRLGPGRDRRRSASSRRGTPAVRSPAPQGPSLCILQSGGRQTRSGQKLRRFETLGPRCAVLGAVTAVSARHGGLNSSVNSLRPNPRSAGPASGDSRRSQRVR